MWLYIFDRVPVQDIKQSIPSHQDNVNICTTDGGVDKGYESSVGEVVMTTASSKAIRHSAGVMWGTRYKLYWVIRSCQDHNAQKSVINWVIAASGRKSNLKTRSYFNVICWLGGGVGGQVC